MTDGKTNPPTYVPPQELYLSKPQKEGDAVVTIVSSSTDTTNFEDQYFTIEQDISVERFITFKVYPSGFNIKPDISNDFLYSFYLKRSPPSMTKLGKTGEYRVVGGRGNSTPCQVGKNPAIVEIGTGENEESYSRFFNPFAQDAADYHFGWKNSPSANEKTAVFQLEKTEISHSFRRVPTTTIPIAEFHINEFGSRIFSTGDGPAWNSIEECAFLVSTGLASVLGSGIKYRKMSAGEMAVAGSVWFLFGLTPEYSLKPL
ncbi:hypothetical protein HDU84_008929 [Entophlyctis sp. JEL0112]|nr:hypothetical protein HDU84_008929 [Entophlyctis sp. JEL0112]